MTRRPNILLILADEHRFDCLGAYGNGQVRTPHLDGLAADGERFDNGFCPYPVCTPSRYSLLTGRFVHEHGGYGNLATPAPSVELFPDLLRRAGYATAAVGKMHFTPTYLDVGFERLTLAEQDGPGRLDDDYHRDLMRRGLMDALDLEDQVEPWRSQAPPEYWQTFGAAVSDLPEEMHSTSWIGQRAVEELDRWAGGGNLLTVGFIKPHHPFDPPARWAAMYDPDATALLPGWTDRLPEHDRLSHRSYFPNEQLTEAALRRVTAFYYATISHMDHHVGRMVERLKRRGLYDDTLIVFTADHGDYLGFHHMLLKGGYLYDPLVKVPLIVKWPAGHRAGSVRKDLVSLVDLAPTILSAAGVDRPAGMSGLDLATDGGRDLVFAEHRRRGDDGQHGEPAVMVRSADRKLLLGGGASRSLFFDLSADPLEMTDLFADPARRGEIERLRRAAAGWLADCARGELHVNRQARQIDQPNVPGPGDAHRRRMLDYFEAAMRNRQAGRRS